MASSSSSSVAASQASIPLRCCICPKRPKFSDLSHLLTHVASKGHLAQQFKTSVRASTDQTARDALDRYNDWFHRYGVEQLCAHRLRSNEQKKARTARRGLLLAAPSMAPPRPGPSVASMETGYVLPLNVDESYYGGLPPARSGADETPLLGSSYDLHPGWTQPHQPQAPRMHLWHTDAYHLHYAPRPLQDGSPTIRSAHSSGPGSPSAPSAGTTAYGYHPGATDSFEMLVGSRHATSVEADRSDETADELERVEGETQLKGVFWPGMDIFDAAPPEMKRRRNQKKDGSVLAQMQRNSTLVEPTELIFLADGEFKRERRIYSPVDHHTLLEGEQPPPRKRPYSKSKPALAEASTNVPKRLPTAMGFKGSDGGLDAIRSHEGMSKKEDRTSQGARGVPKMHHPLAPSAPTVDRKGSKRPAGSPMKKTRAGNLSGGESDKRRARSRSRGEFSAATDGAAPPSFHLTAHPAPGSIDRSPVHLDGAGLGPGQREITSFFKRVDARPCSSSKDEVDHGSFYHVSPSALTAGYPGERSMEEFLSATDPYTAHLFDTHPIDFGTLASPPSLGYSHIPLTINHQFVHGYQSPLLTRGLSGVNPHLYGGGGPSADLRTSVPAFPCRREAGPTTMGHHDPFDPRTRG